jgi:hypothetical protein
VLEQRSHLCLSTAVVLIPFNTACVNNTPRTQSKPASREQQGACQEKMARRKVQHKQHASVGPCLHAPEA